MVTKRIKAVTPASVSANGKSYILNSTNIKNIIMKILMLQGSHPAYVLRQQARQREKDGTADVVLFA